MCLVQKLDHTVTENPAEESAAAVCVLTGFTDERTRQVLGSLGF